MTVLDTVILPGEGEDTLVLEEFAMVTDPLHVGLGKVAIIGDWHGNTEWALRVLKQLAEAGITLIIHVGDFGIFHRFGGEKYLRKIERLLAKNKQTLIVIPGNHEDWELLEKFNNPSGIGTGLNTHSNYPHILLATAGARWTIGEVSFVGLGGANSIDFTYRTEWIDWWRNESISLGDIYNTIEGGYADVMISHDCPAQVPIIADAGKHGENWTFEQLEYAEKSRVALRQAVDAIKPSILFHGHYHVFADLVTELNDGIDDYTVRTVGLDKEFTDGNVVLFDLLSREYEKFVITG